MSDEVVRLAAAQDCSLIVIGSHKGLLGGTAVGGVAKGVLHHTRVPVLIVPPPVAT